MSALSEIYDWQVAAGNIARPYDDFLESSFQVEEAIEGFGNLHILASTVSVDHNLPKLPKEISRAIISIAQGSDPAPISDLDRLDKACDVIVYAIGSIAKLQLTDEQMNRALLVVNAANQAKLGCPRDSEGKLLKPDNFDELHAPEPKLQAILDER